MRKLPRLIVDTASLFRTKLYGGKDLEGGYTVKHEGKEVHINSAEYGYNKVIDDIVALLKETGCAPRDLVLVFEGRNPKAPRYAMYPDYKAKRKPQPEASNIEFQKMSDRLKETFKDLGAVAVSQARVEGDDVIAYLAKNLSGKRIVVSNDGDLAVLQSNQVMTRINGNWNTNPYGEFPSEYITVYKALVGDSSDNIPGALGFGEGAFNKMLEAFGVYGLQAMREHIIKNTLWKLNEDVADLKVLEKVISSSELVRVSYNLARPLYEKVNTKANPLVWEAGLLKQATPETDPRLAQWAGRSIVVNKDNYSKAVALLMDEVPKSAFTPLDIETHVPEEALEWLGESKKVDVFGSELTGLGIACGNNLQFGFYFDVAHKGQGAIGVDKMAGAMTQLASRDPNYTIQNLNFELPVLFNAWGDLWKGNGEQGFLTNVDDTKLMASYVNENIPLGLKSLSKHYLGYDQTTYDEVTQGRQMNELTSSEVLAYGMDDVFTCAALRNLFELVMELEGTWDIYRKVELDAAYMTALSLVQGAKISLETVRKQEQADDIVFDAAWCALRDYLLEKGWDGSLPPTVELTPASIKEIFKVIHQEDLTDHTGKKTAVRTLSKLVAIIREVHADEELAALIEHAEKTNDLRPLVNLVNIHFKGDPQFNLGSYKQVQRLLYTVMGNPVRIKNKPTEKAMSEGATEGQAASNEIAIRYALAFDATEQTEPLLRALLAMKTVNTRRNMFYTPYKLLPHWKDNLVHAQLNQCAAATRRYTCSNPNLQQLPKGKGEFRRAFLPHHKEAVIVSLDFNGQELRLIADTSQDPALLSCYIGDDLRDPHSLTGLSIAISKAYPKWDYATFASILADETHEKYPEVKKFRGTGKTVNFASEFGAHKAKMAQILMCSEDEAMGYLEAKWATFARSEEWKLEVASELHEKGYVTTRLGARRHLAEKLNGTGWEAKKAERQAVNFRIQGSAAEMTKLAMGRVWRSGAMADFDCRFIAPIHDELVFSVHKDQAAAFIKLVHEAMTAPYADMQVPILSSISLGLNFGQQIELGMVPDADIINKSLSDLFTGKVVPKVIENPEEINLVELLDEIENEAYDYV